MKNVAIVILSLIVVIQFIIILCLLPIKTIEDTPSGQWENLQIYND